MLSPIWAIWRRVCTLPCTLYPEHCILHLEPCIFYLVPRVRPSTAGGTPLSVLCCPGLSCPLLLLEVIVAPSFSLSSSCSLTIPDLSLCSSYNPPIVILAHFQLVFGMISSLSVPYTDLFSYCIVWTFSICFMLRIFLYIFLWQTSMLCTSSFVSVHLTFKQILQCINQVYNM